ncbi:hypothetical protein IW261DRAFT_363682 [Armillaria novae-zelandiae]|uniref:Uncharacterized protein n=1 Tax=Armillaria novae-zelandiae TaxID=153914 RepID=A0AA39PQI3_9AGAR|nr:hypothetical protein IW261DRAFT_363682 [Armillaria novae-zelandiae]
MVSRVAAAFVLAVFAGSLSVLAIPVQSESVHPRDGNNTTDILHTWTPSVAVTLLNQVLYPNSTGKEGELTQELGSKLSPLMNGEYWENLGIGKGLKEIIDALPLIGETPINIAMV